MTLPFQIMEKWISAAARRKAGMWKSDDPRTGEPHGTRNLEAGGPVSLVIASIRDLVPALLNLGVHLQLQRVGYR